MSYTSSISISLGKSKAGITLFARLFDTNGDDISSDISSGFAEIGQGNFLWTYDSFPDNFRGGVKFYNQADPLVVLAATSINPEELELVGKIQSDVQSIQAIVTTPPKEITIEVPHIETKGIVIDVVADSSNSSKEIDIKTGVR